MLVWGKLTTLKILNIEPTGVFQQNFIGVVVICNRALRALGAFATTAKKTMNGQCNENILALPWQSTRPEIEGHKYLSISTITIKSHDNTSKPENFPKKRGIRDRGHRLRH